MKNGLPDLMDYELLQNENKQLLSDNARLENLLNIANNLLKVSTPRIEKSIEEDLRRASEYDPSIGFKGLLNKVRNPERLIEVCQKISDGISREELASTFSLSRRTIEGMIMDVRLSMDCKSDAHVVATLIRQGVIT